MVALSPNTGFDMKPVIDGDFVHLREVVRHSSFPTGMKYVENINLVALLLAGSTR